MIMWPRLTRAVFQWPKLCQYNRSGDPWNFNPIGVIDPFFQLVHLRYIDSIIVALWCTILPNWRWYTDRRVLVVYRKKVAFFHTETKRELAVYQTVSLSFILHFNMFASSKNCLLYIWKVFSLMCLTLRKHLPFQNYSWQ